MAVNGITIKNKNGDKIEYTNIVKGSKNWIYNLNVDVWKYREHSIIGDVDNLIKLIKEENNIVKFFGIEAISSRKGTIPIDDIYDDFLINVIDGKDKPNLNCCFVIDKNGIAKLVVTAAKRPKEMSMLGADWKNKTFVPLLFYKGENKVNCLNLK